MISGVKQQDTDLWEAWIEYDQFNTDYFGTLYICGEVLVNISSEPKVVKTVFGNKKSKDLILQVTERPSGRCRMKEVLYAEPIHNLSQYATVSIYSGTELVTRFEEIEVLI
ncbi:MAG TPA: hypothetical protein VM012_06815 [Flavitalea sp.]|nr:hypothetical protein [Flavitalea sp.]